MSLIFFGVSLLASLNFLQASSLRPGVTNDRTALSLPPHFSRLITERAKIDAFQIGHHQVEDAGVPSSVPLFTRRTMEDRYLRIVRSALAPVILEHRLKNQSKVLTKPGFRAPILGNVSNMPTIATWSQARPSPEREAASLIEDRLAHDGLLPTLSQVIDIFGRDAFLKTETSFLDRLEGVGFPVDLLEFFKAQDRDGSWHRGSQLIPFVARLKLQANAAGSLEKILKEIQFDFIPSAVSRSSGPSPVPTKFEAGLESGEEPLGLLRVQAGGGFRGGVTPGDSIDVISQLVAALPRTDFLISLPEEMLPPFMLLVTNTWRLRRTNQVTLVAEPMLVTGWAQDNGKAGSLTGPGRRQSATITPRYASREEGRSIFDPGESYLMDGLAEAGHAVIHSPLLFQGGNILSVRDPKSGQRCLLIGEGEIYRNVALGLSPEQAAEAFRLEFGVDRCVILPAASYHLDFDLTLRVHRGEMMAFVNDPAAASRIILRLGVTAMERHGSLTESAARRIRAELATGADLEAVAVLRRALNSVAAGKKQFPSSISRFFAVDKLDSGSGNFQCFLLALDWLESTLDSREASSEKAEYLKSLRELDRARMRQMEAVKKLGWKIVAVPSMPDLYRGINYLNGIQHRDGYLMPVFAGFYGPLDQSAQEVFRSALGSEFRLTTIRSAECQRQHGGIHCTASAYARE